MRGTAVATIFIVPSHFRCTVRLLFDLRLAVRGLRRDWPFTLAVGAMLSIALALNVTGYTVTSAMLWRGFPHVKQNDRLVYIRQLFPSGLCCLSYRDFEDWRAQAQTFAAMAYVASNRQSTFRDGDGRPMDLLTMRVTANTFGLLGVAPALGRDFVAADEAPGAPQVAILNDRFWESRFGRRANVVGQIVHINGAPATIIGVMPKGFDFPFKENLWMPLVRTPELLARGLTPGGFTVVGRLRAGVSIDQARAELDTINRALEHAYPATNRGVYATLVTHSEFTSGDHARVIWGSTLAGAWFVLLVACANVATLMLVRTVGRRREFATSIALGAGSGRVLRQIAIESVLLSASAGALAWPLTQAAVRNWADTTVSRYQVLDYAVNGDTLLYLCAITALVAVLLSIAPIGHVARLATASTLVVNARAMTQDARSKRLAASLVAAQMALAVVLLSGSGVLVRSFANIVGAETGVRSPEQVLVGLLRLPSDKYPTPAARQQYFERAVARLQTLPEVDNHTVASTIPVRYAALRMFEIDGQPAARNGSQSVGVLATGSEYFQVAGLSAIAGRAFDDSDIASSLPVAIVNESFVATYWPGEQALGKRIRFTAQNASGDWRVIVGVVPNIMQGDPLRQTFRPLVYVPFRQDPPASAAYFLVRSSVALAHVAGAVRQTLQDIDRDVSLENIRTLEESYAFDRDFMDADHSELGKHAAVAPVFAFVALLLAAVGLIAVVAHSVSQRTKEIGVRMAIGAEAADISRMILRQGMMPVALGIVAGLAGSFAVNRVLQSQLVGVSPYDPIAMTVAPLFLMIVALAACQIPARRAMRVDPVVALKHE